MRFLAVVAATAGLVLGATAYGDFYGDSLYARDLDGDLVYARDFDDDVLCARDVYDDELYARDFYEDELDILIARMANKAKDSADRIKGNEEKRKGSWFDTDEEDGKHSRREVRRISVILCCLVY